MEEVEFVPVSLAYRKEAMLREIMKEYGENVLHFVYLTVKDRTIAEDIAQEVFLKVYRSLDTFRGECSMKTWVYKIAKSLRFMVKHCQHDCHCIWIEC